MKKFAGPAVFLVCLALYTFTMSRTALPGDSARQIVAYGGIDTFPVLSHPVFTLVAHAVKVVPIGTFAARMNLLSALCAALCAWLVFHLSSRTDHNRTFEETVSHFNASAAQLISGITATALFALALPVWIVATRAHTASFDLLLLLSSVALLTRFGLTGRMTEAYASCALWSVAMTEFATCIILAPFFAGALLLSLYRRNMFNARKVSVCAIFGLAGLLPYFIHAAWYCAQPAFEWRDFKNYGEVLRYIFLDQYHAIVHGLPRFGWLTVMISTFVPWLVIFCFRSPGNKGGSRGAWFGSYLLNGVLTAIALMVFLNGRASPWVLTHTRPLLVTPYLLVAIWGGYLAGYWYVVFSREDRREFGAAKSIRRGLYYLYFPALAAVLLCGGWKNAAVADGRSGVHAARFADVILDSLKDRDWLVTNGAFDDLLLLAAWEKNREVRLINYSLTGGGANAYLRYVATLFEDPRLRSLARVAPGPLLREILTSHPELAARFAILNQPDLWFVAGLEPVPNRVLFLGARPEEPVLPEAEIQAQLDFVTEFGHAVTSDIRSESLSAPWNGWIAMHLGRIANNLGVYLEDHGQDGQAMAAYAAARGVDTNNISALINQHALAKRKSLPEYKDLDVQLNALAKRLQSAGRRLWGLAQTFGYVRNAPLYASRGWAWAMTGKPSLASSEMTRALEMGGQQGGAQLLMARLYYAREMQEESESGFLSVLKQDPNNRTALSGLLRLSLRKSDLDSARVYLARLEDMKVPAASVIMDKAILEFLAGNSDTALALLSQYVQEDSNNVQAWAAMAAIALQVENKEVLEKALDKLQAARILPPEVRMAVATIEISRNNRAVGRKHLNELLRVAPGDKKALEALLRLDIYEGQRDMAEQHVEQLLTVDSRNALANYVLGTLQVDHEQLALAETSFRTSLDARRTPEALNDLAWVLTRRGAFDEALKYSRESLAMNDKSGPAWDTLGVIMLNRGELGEAEGAFQKALALMPNHAGVQLNMAKLYEKKGLVNDASRIVNELMARPSELRRDAYDELRDLAKRLR